MLLHSSARTPPNPTPSVKQYEDNCSTSELLRRIKGVATNNPISHLITTAPLESIAHVLSIRNPRHKVEPICPQVKETVSAKHVTRKYGFKVYYERQQCKVQTGIKCYEVSFVHGINHGYVGGISWTLGWYLRMPTTGVFNHSWLQNRLGKKITIVQYDAREITQRWPGTALCNLNLIKNIRKILVFDTRIRSACKVVIENSIQKRNRNA